VIGQEMGTDDKNQVCRSWRLEFEAINGDGLTDDASSDRAALLTECSGPLCNTTHACQRGTGEGSCPANSMIYIHNRPS
jgi:hypothetical protein